MPQLEFRSRDRGVDRTRFCHAPPVLVDGAGGPWRDIRRAPRQRGTAQSADDTFDNTAA